MLDARAIAIQGIGYAAPIVAVQGFLAAAAAITGTLAATEGRDTFYAVGGVPTLAVVPPLFIVNMGRMMGR